WEVEKVFEPGAGNLLDDGGGGGGGIHAGVLVPNGGEPVGGESGGEIPANYPAEEARARGVDDAAFDCFDEVVDDFGRVLSGIVEGKREVLAQGGEVCGSGYGGGGRGREVIDGVLESGGEGSLKWRSLTH